MYNQLDNEIIAHLAQYITDHKKDLVDAVLNMRTRHVTVVLEDIYQSQNASAVIRTCECMGLQDIHIIENKSKYQLNTRVLKGADKWVHMVRHRQPNTNNTDKCFLKLRSEGYKIFVTDPSANGLSIHDINPLQNKVAIVFGNELRGASAYAIDNCDNRIKIPMFGFTESLNISVSVAMCLNTLILPLRQSFTDFGLTFEEKLAIKLQWYRKIVRRSDIIEREFLRAIK